MVNLAEIVNKAFYLRIETVMRRYKTVCCTFCKIFDIDNIAHALFKARPREDRKKKKKTAPGRSHTGRGSVSEMRKRVYRSMLFTRLLSKKALHASRQLLSRRQTFDEHPVYH